MGLFFGSQTPKDEEEEVSEEEVSEEEVSEEEVSEEEVSEEEETESDSSSFSEHTAIVDSIQLKLEREERVDFQRDCRKLFLNEWLPAEGGWLAELSAPQLDFLRDLLGLPNGAAYSPRTYPSYQPW